MYPLQTLLYFRRNGGSLKRTLTESFSGIEYFRMKKEVEITFNGTNFDVYVDHNKISVGEGKISPMSLVLVALGGCTGMDVVSILRKMKVNFDLRIFLEGIRREEHPRVYREIHLHYRFYGNNIPEKGVLKAVSLSLNRYCSVSAMLSKSCPIYYRVYINDREVKDGKKYSLEGEG